MLGVHFAVHEYLVAVLVCEPEVARDQSLRREQALAGQGYEWFSVKLLRDLHQSKEQHEASF